MKSAKSRKIWLLAGIFFVILGVVQIAVTVILPPISLYRIAQGAFGMVVGAHLIVRNR